MVVREVVNVQYVPRLRLGGYFVSRRGSTKLKLIFDFCCVTFSYMMSRCAEALVAVSTDEEA